jgi:hypothetical protein
MQTQPRRVLPKAVRFKPVVLGVLLNMMPDFFCRDLSPETLTEPSEMAFIDGFRVMKVKEKPF